MNKVISDVFQVLDTPMQNNTLISEKLLSKNGSLEISEAYAGKSLLSALAGEMSTGLVEQIYNQVLMNFETIGDLETPSLFEAVTEKDMKLMFK